MAGASVNQGNFLIQVARGDIDRHSDLRKFGVNTSLSVVDTYEDVWDYGGTHTYTGTTPVAYYVSSSDATDTQPVSFLGLGADKTLQSFTMSLNGQTKKQIVNPLAGGETWWRLFRIKNVGSTDFTGTIYTYEDDTVTAGVPDTPVKVRASVNPPFNQTLMALYTVPADKNGYMLMSSASIADKKSARVAVRLWTREEGGVWQIKRIFALASDGTSTVSNMFMFPQVLEPKTDVRVDAASNTAGTAISAEFEILLVDTDI